MDIDISWNHFSISGMIKFLDFMAVQSKIKLINLSWNHLNQTKLMTKIRNDIYEDVVFDAIPSLCSLLETSTYLQHIDISNT